jgi:hypothetical protein
VTLGELGADSAARRAVPFVAIFPGAVWMAVSADGLFAGVATAGLALVCVGAARGRLLASLLGGLLLGTTLFLSYGLVLFGLVVLTALAVSIHQRGLRSSVGLWLVTCAGVAAVVAWPWWPLRGVAALVADLSALSKAETERIWLTFGLASLPRRRARSGLKMVLRPSGNACGSMVLRGRGLAGESCVKGPSLLPRVREHED